MQTKTEWKILETSKVVMHNQPPILKILDPKSPDYHSSVTNKRIKELKLDLISEILLAN